MKNNYKKLISAISLVIILLVICQFLLSNSMVSSGTTLEDVNGQIDVLTSENRLLTRELAISRSLDSIKTRALSAGFIKATTFISLPMVQTVALR